MTLPRESDSEVEHRPRTVGQLVAFLSDFDPDLLVLVDGYEGGFDPITSSSTRSVSRHDEQPGWWGRYDDDDAAGERALVLHR